jgi:hypothetical protein
MSSYYALFNTAKETATPITPLDPRVEMFQKTYGDGFFNVKALAPRPQSTVTLIYDTEFEDDNSSDIEIEEDYSPRVSLNSVRSTIQVIDYFLLTFLRLDGGVKRRFRRTKRYKRPRIPLSNRLIST